MEINLIYRERLYIEGIETEYKKHANLNLILKLILNTYTLEI